MQRWILIGVTAIIFVIGGGGFAFWQMKQNRPQPIWIPLPINAGLPLEQRDAMVKQLKTDLSKKDRLVQISKDLGLTRKLHLATDDDVAVVLSQRLFVKVGEVTKSTGTIPTVDIGVDGVRKEAKVSEEIAKRLLQDVWKILGVKPPPAP